MPLLPFPDHLVRGDIFYWDGVQIQRLRAGSANEVLALSSGIPDWVTLASLNVTAGTYSPTLTNVANLDGSTAYDAQYLRVGATVFVSGKVDVNPTAPAAATQLGMSLPVASNIGAVEDVGGTAFASGIAGQGAAIIGDAANNRAEMNWVAGDVTNQPMYYSYGYQIL